MRYRISRESERGATLVEFAIGATVFLTVMFAILEFGRMLYVHNALSDAARRGARYAVVHTQADVENVKLMAVYGTTSGGTQPLVDHLTTDNIFVQYSGAPNAFGVNKGTVSVQIQNYDFTFSIPLVGGKVTMPKYTTTLTGENAGIVLYP
ncbi:MAG TPA: TadE/TadG family type IV pilus assembly protein [Pyrinomonadaceae bacterium]|jgi:Flp pilus assembly protein TadG|nr:TadE/TadG family type IV pilus assembly protein [Pyrinomonadaceae bacterium]